MAKRTYVRGHFREYRNDDDDDDERFIRRRKSYLDNFCEYMGWDD